MVFNSPNNQFYQSDLDLHLMALVLELDLDMVKMSYHTKNELSMSRHSKVIACTDTHTQTHRQHENTTFPHTRAVMNELTLSETRIGWDEVAG